MLLLSLAAHTVRYVPIKQKTTQTRARKQYAVRRQISAIAAVTAIFFAGAAPANGMWTHWGPWIPVVRFEQRYTIDVAGEKSFWATQFHFVEQPHSGGYIGVQTGGWAFELGRADVALFSIWDATWADPGPGAVCGAFGGEGVGLSCRKPIKVESGHKYGVVVKRSVTQGGTDQNSMFTAWVVNYSTGELVKLGAIAVPYVVTMSPPSNFIEYFGPSLPCMEIPHAAASFHAPLILRKNGWNAERMIYSGTSAARCSKETVDLQGRRVKISTGTKR